MTNEKDESRVDQILDFLVPDFEYQGPISEDVVAGLVNTLRSFVRPYVEEIAPNDCKVIHDALSNLDLAERTLLMEIIPSYLISDRAAELNASSLGELIIALPYLLAFIETDDHQRSMMQCVHEICAEESFDGNPLDDPLGPHAQCVRGIVIEGGLFNYAFDLPMHYEYLGKHAEAIKAQATRLLAMDEMMSIERIDAAISGGSYTLMNGVL